MEFEMLDQETAGKTIIKVVGVGGLVAMLSSI